MRDSCEFRNKVFAIFIKDSWFLCLQMEATIAQQTKELIQTKDKLASHDAAAKRAVQTLQTELKKRVDEVNK